MVRKYTPQKNKLELEIKKERFNIDAFDPTLLKRIEIHRKTLNEQGAKLQNQNKEISIEELESALEESIKLCVDVIDDLLGEGSTERIFKDEPISFLDAVDIATFIFQEITEYIVVDVAKKYNPNRAARRSE